MLRARVVQLTGDIASPGLGGSSSALDGEAGFRSVRRPPCASQRPRIRGIEHHQLLSPSAASKPTAHECRSSSCRLPLIHVRPEVQIGAIDQGPPLKTLKQASSPSGRCLHAFGALSATFLSNCPASQLKFQLPRLSIEHQ